MARALSYPLNAPPSCFLPSHAFVRIKKYLLLFSCVTTNILGLALLLELSFLLQSHFKCNFSFHPILRIHTHLLYPIFIKIQPRAPLGGTISDGHTFLKRECMNLKKKKSQPALRSEAGRWHVLGNG